MKTLIECIVLILGVGSGVAVILLGLKTNNKQCSMKKVKYTIAVTLQGEYVPYFLRPRDIRDFGGYPSKTYESLEECQKVCDEMNSIKEPNPLKEAL